MKYLIAFATILICLAGRDLKAQGTAKELYELRVYELTMGSLGRMEDYLSKALIPALNRSGVQQVGVFREMGMNEPAKIYVLIPYASIQAYGSSMDALAKDAAYQAASQEYRKLERPVYFRFKTTLMRAFDGLPKMVVPQKGERIFELRTYEGYSEGAVARKIKMFNEGELKIFDDVKLNPVFFGEVISGDNLPCLQYMITFRNMEERDNNWKDFSAHPDWTSMSRDPQYANTVSKIIRVFLEPTAYSQI